MEEQLKVRKKEVLEYLVAPIGWVAIKQDIIEVKSSTKSGIFVPSSVALDDFDVRNRLNMEEAHPYSGIVIASGVDNVFAGDKVLISKVCNDNFSSHIKFAGEVLKLIRVGDILGLVRKENLYE